MSALRISNACRPVNPAFTEAFITIAEFDTLPPIELTAIPALLDIDDAESRQESLDIQNMAIFLLLANEMLGVKYQNAFRFGDVDLMDAEPCDWDNHALIVQYDLED